MPFSQSATKTWSQLVATFETAWPREATDVGVVVACSGGADSVALVRLVDHCLEFRKPHAGDFESDACGPVTKQPPLVIAHFNHRLRGHESNEDQAFVVRLAAKLKRNIEIGFADIPDGDCDEASLRHLRRTFLEAVAAKHGCRYVVTGHTADDQAETVLHHLVRGTGPSGLSGIRSYAPLGDDFVLRRPMLNLSRNDIREALRDLGQPWREDASNSDTVYTRNWIRHEVLPLIRERFNRAEEAIARTASIQTELTGLTGRLASQWIDAFASTIGSELRLSKPRVANPNGGWPHALELAMEPLIVTTACQRMFDRMSWARQKMNQAHWQRLTDLIVADEPQDAPEDAPEKCDGVRMVGQWPGGLSVFADIRRVSIRSPG